MDSLVPVETGCRPGSGHRYSILVVSRVLVSRLTFGVPVDSSVDVRSSYMGGLECQMGRRFTLPRVPPPVHTCSAEDPGQNHTALSTTTESQCRLDRSEAQDVDTGVSSGVFLVLFMSPLYLLPICPLTPCPLGVRGEGRTTSSESWLAERLRVGISTSIVLWTY
jgi:hypothetical protein